VEALNDWTGPVGANGFGRIGEGMRAEVFDLEQGGELDGT
jgi:hypothetical protein